jgi:hypothetical protein
LVPQLEGPWSTQRESGVFCASGLHVPTLPGRLQELQALLQAVLQQIPAAQNLLPHSPLVVQLPPFGFNPHDPLVQT